MATVMCCYPADQVGGAMPMQQLPMQQQGMMGMSPEALKHQHVVNHLACREAACPQGVNPQHVAIWGARRDGMERCAPCPEPMAPQMQPSVQCVPVSPHAQPMVPQMQPSVQCVPVSPHAQPMAPQMQQPQMYGGMGAAPMMGSGPVMGAASRTVSYVDWGGRWSASPEYDAAGSPHGYYGPPAVAAMMQQNGMPGGRSSFTSGFPQHFGNAYPGQLPHGSRANAPDLSHDEYYQRRESEIRTGRLPGPKVPQGTKAYFPDQPTTPGRYTTRPASKAEIDQIKKEGGTTVPKDSSKASSKPPGALA